MSEKPISAIARAAPPSPGTPGEGGGEGDFEQRTNLVLENHPKPNPLPEYRERGPATEKPVDQIARAVLYEGYILYPYRPSVKNTQRWTFGGIFPHAWSESSGGSDSSAMQTQCLIVADGSTRVSITLRFLHLTDRTVEKSPSFERVQSLRVGKTEFQSWQEAIEREVQIDQIAVDDLLQHSQRREFSFEGAENTELVREADQTVGRLVRQQQSISGAVELSAETVERDLHKLTVRVVNQTPIEQNERRDQALMRAFASTHLILTAGGGEFLSLTDPLPSAAEFAAQCRNIGCWPVLVGAANQTDTLLVSPIILPDYPQIAPESPGDLFDGGEIDEILTLRIMTLTDEEKRQAASIDDRVRKMLERTENLAREQLMNLHGAVRGLKPATEEQQHV